MPKVSQRPSAYQYIKLFAKHLGRQGKKGFQPFKNNPVLPRQLEIHLPNPTTIPCNSKCFHCQGRNLEKSMVQYDDQLFSLIETLDGRIPLFIISGNFTEPTLNPKLIDLLELIKKTGSHFGLHTNGMLLTRLEASQGFLTRLYNISSDKKDYLSLALDAGDRESFARIKGAVPGQFNEILEAFLLIDALAKDKLKPHLKTRVTHLLNRFNCSTRELAGITSLLKSLEIDSLRFSIPYAAYRTPMQECLDYHLHFELPFFQAVWNRVKPFLSQDGDEKPLIFALSPSTQDINQMTFKHCFMGYYEITLGADGYFYRCCSSAASNFSTCRLGKMTTDYDRFLAMVAENQRKSFDPQENCFPFGARCTRAGMAINQEFERKYYNGI